MQRVLVVCNPFAGGGNALKTLELYKAYASGQDRAEYRFYVTEQPGDYEGMSTAINAFNPEVVSVVGGDGTVNEVVNVPEVRERSLHLVPSGSGNDFHRLVYGNISIRQSIECSASTKRKEYDLGVCNGRYFMNGVGIGFDGSVATHTVRMKLPLLSSKWKYWLAILRNLFFYKGQEMELRYANHVIKEKLFMVDVANGNEYGGGFRVSPRSRADDGLLDVVAIRDLSPLRRIFKLPVVKNGKHMDDPIVFHDTTPEITIVSGTQLYAHLDGEIMAGHEFVIKLEKKIPFVV